MNKEWYANASLGIAVVYKPSSIGNQINPDGLHSFIYDGYVDFRKKISADFNAISVLNTELKNQDFSTWEDPLEYRFLRYSLYLQGIKIKATT